MRQLGKDRHSASAGSGSDRRNVGPRLRWSSRWRERRFRIQRHPLGPRVYFLGARWHDWHLGLLVLVALAIGALAGLVHDGFPTALAAFAGLWLIAKDWRDLTSHRRDTAAWRLVWGAKTRCAPRSIGD